MVNSSPPTRVTVSRSMQDPVPKEQSARRADPQHPMPSTKPTGKPPTSLRGNNRGDRSLVSSECFEGEMVREALHAVDSLEDVLNPKPPVPTWHGPPQREQRRVARGEARPAL